MMKHLRWSKRLKQVMVLIAGMYFNYNWEYRRQYIA